MTRVKLPLSLRSHASNQAVVEVTGDSVGACIDQLELHYPPLVERLRDEEGELAPGVNLYVNGQDVRYLGGLEAPVSDTDEVTIVMAIAGG